MSHQSPTTPSPTTLTWTPNLSGRHGQPEQARSPVTIFYGRTKDESEEIARKFLGEPVLGFDMEWPHGVDSRKDPLPRPQERISLIVVATDSAVGLFHLGLHDGTTPDDILAPSLRKLIESPDITKATVGIMSYFSRLSRFFHLNPRGAFELSHLYHLAKYGAWKPKAVTMQLKTLTKQAHKHLFMDLKTPAMRLNDGIRPLDPVQLRFAATDAYAGFLLYNRLNEKRSAMNPAAPLPIHAETYVPIVWGSAPTRLVHLRWPSGSISVEDWSRMSAIYRKRSLISSKNDDASVPDKAALKPSTTLPQRSAPQRSAPQYSAPQYKDTEPLPKPSGSGVVRCAVERPTVVQPPPAGRPNPLDALFNLLFAHRKRTAARAQVPEDDIVSMAGLNALTRHFPCKKFELVKIKGAGVTSQQLKRWGPAWLAIINRFVRTQNLARLVVAAKTRL